MFCINDPDYISYSLQKVELGKKQIFRLENEVDNEDIKVMLVT